MKIAVAGTGYVGLSMATLLAQHNEVVAVDVIPEKVEKINRRVSPIQDEYIEKYFAEKQLNLTATLDAETAYRDADFVIVATPTNYDSRRNFFDTSAVESVIEKVIKCNPSAIVIIKSTIPVGYTESIRMKTGSNNILFSPEFLRESKALYDNLYPSRIIVGRPEGDDRLDKAARTFASLLVQGAIGKQQNGGAGFQGHRQGDLLFLQSEKIQLAEGVDAGAEVIGLRIDLVGTVVVDKEETEIIQMAIGLENTGVSSGDPEGLGANDLFKAAVGG